MKSSKVAAFLGIVILSCFNIYAVTKFLFTQSRNPNIQKVGNSPTFVNPNFVRTAAEATTNKYKALLENILATADAPDLPYATFDVVYTWVNGSDPNFVGNRSHYFPLFMADLLKKPLDEIKAQTNNQYHSDSQFRDHEELKYSIRSVLRHAPWIRHIYIVVSDGQVYSY